MSNHVSMVNFISMNKLLGLCDLVYHSYFITILFFIFEVTLIHLIMPQILKILYNFLLKGE